MCLHCTGVRKPQAYPPAGFTLPQPCRCFRGLLESARLIADPLPRPSGACELVEGVVQPQHHALVARHGLLLRVGLVLGVGDGDDHVDEEIEAKDEVHDEEPG